MHRWIAAKGEIVRGDSPQFSRLRPQNTSRKRKKVGDDAAINRWRCAVAKLSLFAASWRTLSDVQHQNYLYQPGERHQGRPCSLLLGVGHFAGARHPETRWIIHAHSWREPVSGLLSHWSHSAARCGWKSWGSANITRVHINMQTRTNARQQSFGKSMATAAELEVVLSPARKWKNVICLFLDVCVGERKQM